MATESNSMGTPQENPAQTGSATEWADDELLQNLRHLCQIDIDAVFAYEEALEHIDPEHSELIQNIERFRDEHVAHVMNLNSILLGFDADAPDLAQDWEGFVIEGFTAVRSQTGTVGAVKALKFNEELINREYERALTWNGPDGLREILQEQKDDEGRHLSFINDCLGRLGLSQEESERDVEIEQDHQREEQPHLTNLH